MTYTEAPSPATDISPRTYKWTAAAILVLALLLRIRGARGDLGQDEILSLKSLQSVTRIDQIFWKINFDNNHPLNSAWLYVVGPFASSLMIRALSSVLGVVTVMAAGLWGFRRSVATGLIDMILMATAYFMVNYQSEARGYAGLMLCMIVAALATEGILKGRDQHQRLAVALGFGYLFHPYIVFTAGALGAAFAWTIWQRDHDLTATADATIRAFKGAALAMALAASPLLFHKFEIGSVMPFQSPLAFDSYADAVRTTLTVPGLHQTWFYVLAATGLAIANFAFRPREFRAAFYLMMIVGMPLALALGHMPNLSYPRYLIMVPVGLLLLAADLLAALWIKRRAKQALAAVLLVIVLCGNAILLDKFYATTRGYYSEAVAAMTADGPTSYAVGKQRVVTMVDFYAARLGRQAKETTIGEWCAHPPVWFILDSASLYVAAPTLTMGPTTCPTFYGDPVYYPGWGLTSLSWLVYRRQ